MIRRYGDPARQDIRYTHRPGVYVVLARGQSILLTHQSEPVPEFQLPGGGIDVGESLLCALHREVLEETGWRIAVTRRLGVYRRFTFMPDYDLWAEKLCHIYLARPARCIGLPSEAGHQAVWATYETAVGLLANEGDRSFLRAAISRYSP